MTDTYYMFKVIVKPFRLPSNRKKQMTSLWIKVGKELTRNDH